MKKFPLIIASGIIVLLTATTLKAQLTGLPQGYSTQPIQTIILKDGTTLKGRLIGVSGDQYIIETSHMGQVSVLIADTVSITTGQNFPSTGQMGNIFGGLTGGQQAMPSQLGQFGQSFLADPEVQAAVQELMSDPEIMALMQNDQLKQDVFTMNPQQIYSNPNIQQLMQNPKVQKIINRLSDKMPQANPFLK